MSDLDDLRCALNEVVAWTGRAMDTSKPNSNLYEQAERDQRWAQRKLVEIRDRRS